jgi:Cu+-exporting ATPase
MQQKTNVINCYHCGDVCNDTSISLEDKSFCCQGCKTVFEILQSNDMENFYSLNNSPGIQLKKNKKNYDYLDNPEITEKLLDFSDDGISVVRLFLPAIHCSSCIWLLEHLGKLQDGVISCQVNFPKRTAHITFRNEKVSLKEIAKLLESIGYEPLISLEDTNKNKKQKDKTLLYKFGIAGFAFGNIMIMALPEYFDYSDATLQRFLPFFRWLMLGLCVPVVFYSASDYFTSAYKGLKRKYINIDVPIALGISVLFLRSAYEVIADTGPGFFDSLAGLVFFLTLGKFFQRKTYDSLSFDRDYKSYFPVAVTRLGKKEESIQVGDLKTSDRILIRNEELIPTDSILISKEAYIDNSFVTGEATLVRKQSGDKIFAGGIQNGEAIELEVIKPIDQSYLTQLWNHEIFNKEQGKLFKNITDRISHVFTFAILLIASAAALYWYLIDPKIAFTVFTAILIVACPCALALSAPFTLGNTLRIFGRNKLYIKNADAVESMASIDQIVWDKTGTITESGGHDIIWRGTELSPEQINRIKSLTRQSNHPLSRIVYKHLYPAKTLELVDFKETTGSGISAIDGAIELKLGSAKFIGKTVGANMNETLVHYSENNEPVGYFILKNPYRSGVKRLINALSNYGQALISGDSDGQKTVLENLFANNTELLFNQKPEDKLEYIKSLQEKEKHVLMFGDGLNDAGALKQSNLGISISEDVNAFSPACDGILDASSFDKIDNFLAFSKTSVAVIKWSFIFSFSYNLVGLYFAATNQLSPVVSAILMPLSSISIVAFVTLATNLLAKRKGL